MGLAGGTRDVQQPGVERDNQRRAAALRAGRLGLYVNDGGQRVRIPVAELLTNPTDLDNPTTARALAEALQTRGMRTL